MRSILPATLLFTLTSLNPSGAQSSAVSSLVSSVASDLSSATSSLESQCWTLTSSIGSSAPSLSNKISSETLTSSLSAAASSIEASLSSATSATKAGSSAIAVPSTSDAILCGNDSPDVWCCYAFDLQAHKNVCAGDDPGDKCEVPVSMGRKLSDTTRIEDNQMAMQQEEEG